MSDRSKITETHRRRRAVVYVRQSTPTQLERNHESRARQYALRERALELGWPAASVSVVDDDLGRSGASTDGRLGFKELVAEVGLGRVGLVLALEVSRFARRSADWHQLLDLCALTGTLIADQDGIYSPHDFNDRLLLGLKGTMSEAELHLIRARLTGGLRNKAKRGELEQNLPVGLDRDEDGRIVLVCRRAGASRDRARVHAVAAGRVSATGRRRAARRGPAAAAAHGRLAARAVGAGDAIRAVHDFLTNPAYAGAFVFGRTRDAEAARRAGTGAPPDGRAAVEQWSVCLPEHHPGYVTWDQYLATRERLRANVRPRGEGGGAAREGGGLLQGILRCGRCGRRMQVAYSGNDGRTLAMRACAPSISTAGSAASRSAGYGSRRRSRTRSWKRSPRRRARVGRGDRRDRAPARRAARRPAARRRARAVRSRPRAPQVRRLRAGEPARRAARSSAHSRRRSPSWSASSTSSPNSNTGGPSRSPTPSARRWRGSPVTSRESGRPTRPRRAIARSCCAR